MAQHILNVRVRPARVAVLIGKTAGPEELLVGLRFLSYLWGGRFCQLLATEPTSDDPLTSFRLSQSRPDFVYGIAVDHAAWEPRVLNACQPLGYRPLGAEYVEKLHLSREEHITAAHVIRHLRRTPIGPGLQERPLRIVGCDPKSSLLPFLAALLGSHYPNLGNVVPNEECWFSDAGTVPDLIAIHTGMVSGFARCWLDLASHGLNCRLVGLMEIPPTIVLVDSLVSDLALFWNLRAAGDTDLPVWAIPIPASSASDPEVLARLRGWLLAFEPYGRHPNFCRVTSTSLPPESLNDFAARLQQGLEGTHVKYVDPWVPPNRLPVVIGYESEQQPTAELAGGRLRFRPPSPQVLEGGVRGAWVVEVEEDVRTKRVLKDLCLPPRPSAFAVLNTPGPLSISLTHIPRLGDGLEGITVRCSGRQEVTSIYLPTGTEILEEVLRDGGVRPEADEKRACYLPVMRMFGGLERAAQAFSGQRGMVLRALTGGTLDLSEIQGRARLGRGKLPELAQPQLPEGYLQQLDPVARRVLHLRSREHWCRVSPGTTETESLLEFWADRGIVTRQWRLGPCPACMGTFWEPRLDISRPVRCPGCGSRLRLPPQVSLGYSLHRLVGHAIRQGIIPVVLTGRFLKHLSHRGFFWLPGVKFAGNDKDGDVDVLACCDGHIAVGECKTLEGAVADAGVWGQILEQFRQTIEVGKACGAAFAVLAVMADGFPADFQARVEMLAGPFMKCLLLNRDDLEAGYRKTPADGPGRGRLTLGDLVVEPMPEAPRPRPAEPRQVITPLFIANY
jgi:hypothetical protein